MFEAPKKMLSISGTNRFNRRGSTRQPHATSINRSVNIWPQRETLSSAGRALPNDGAFFLGSHASGHVVGRHSNGAQIARAAARPNFHTAAHRNSEVAKARQRLRRRYQRPTLRGLAEKKDQASFERRSVSQYQPLLGLIPCCCRVAPQDSGSRVGDSIDHSIESTIPYIIRILLCRVVP